MNAVSALRHYQEAIRVDPDNTEALWRASREVMDLGEFDDRSRDSLYRLGEQYARALHVMAMWHANVMRLSGMSRFLAKNLLGGKVFDEASWKDAVAYLERAVALEPDRVLHRLNLGGIYADSGNTAKARETWHSALGLTATESNDKHYQRQASESLKALR